MPEILKNPIAILFDKNKKNLTYVFEMKGSDRLGKFVIEVGVKDTVYYGKDNRVSRTLNKMVTAGHAERHNFKDKNVYEVLFGKL
jgi:hypothetical protein